MLFAMAQGRQVDMAFQGPAQGPGSPSLSPLAEKWTVQ